MAAGPMTGRAEAAAATLAPGLTDPTTMIGVGPREEEALAAAVVAVAAKTTTVVIAIQARMTRVPRKATWVDTITISRALRKGSTSRTATTTLQVPASIVTRQVVMTRATVTKVRLRVA